MDQHELDVLSARLRTLEENLSRSRRRNRALVGLVLAGGALAWAGAALSAPSTPFPCSRNNLYCFKANEPAVAEQVNSNFEVLARTVEATTSNLARTVENEIDTVTANVETRLPIAGGKLTGVVSMEGEKAIGGGNGAGNLHFDSNGSGTDGRIYLNWYSGKGVLISDGKQGTIATFTSSTGKAAIGGKRVPSEVVSSSCDTGSCSSTCPTGTKIKMAFGFHGLYPSAATGSTWACGSAWQWRGDCIGKDSCSIIAACNTSGMWIECW